LLRNHNLPAKELVNCPWWSDMFSYRL